MSKLTMEAISHRNEFSNFLKINFWIISNFVYVITDFSPLSGCFFSDQKLGSKCQSWQYFLKDLLRLPKNGKLLLITQFLDNICLFSCVSEQKCIWTCIVMLVAILDLRTVVYFDYGTIVSIEIIHMLSAFFNFYTRPMFNNLSLIKRLHPGRKLTALLQKNVIVNNTRT